MEVSISSQYTHPLCLGQHPHCPFPSPPLRLMCLLAEIHSLPKLTPSHSLYHPSSFFSPCCFFWLPQMERIFPPRYGFCWHFSLIYTLFKWCHKIYYLKYWSQLPRISKVFENIRFWYSPPKSPAQCSAANGSSMNNRWLITVDGPVDAGKGSLLPCIIYERMKEQQHNHKCTIIPWVDSFFSSQETLAIANSSSREKFCS